MRHIFIIRTCTHFQLRTRNSIRGFVGPSVGPSVGPFVVIELEIVKTRISAPAHPSATGIGRVSGLIFIRTSFLGKPSMFLNFEQFQALNVFEQFLLQTRTVDATVVIVHMWGRGIERERQTDRQTKEERQEDSWRKKARHWRDETSDIIFLLLSIYLTIFLRIFRHQMNEVDSIEVRRLSANKRAGR